MLKTCLLCCIVVFQVGMSAYAAEPQCPMSQDHGAMSMPADDTRIPDCCNDAETAALTGQMCKTDMPCGSPGALALSSFRDKFSTPQAVAVAAVPQPMYSSFDPPGIWRPPSNS